MNSRSTSDSLVLPDFFFKMHLKQANIHPVLLYGVILPKAQKESVKNYFSSDFTENQVPKHLHRAYPAPAFTFNVTFSDSGEQQNLTGEKYFGATGGPEALTQDKDDCQKQTHIYQSLTVIEKCVLKLAWQMEA